MDTKNNPYRSLPSVAKLLEADALQPAIAAAGFTVVKEVIQAEIDAWRKRIAAQDEEVAAELASPELSAKLCRAILATVSERQQQALKPVFNLSGIVLHTNLGRARLPAEAIALVSQVAAEYSNLEFNLEDGKRGDRDTHLEALICHLTGAEAATIVNNNAAAVMLVLNTLAASKEVLISRGELVEIGGSFRIPDVMRSANCLLREVGTTNRTHLHDYQHNLGVHSGLIMKVHTSNYQIQGFTNAVSASALANLASEANIPFVEDLGSGCLLDMQQYGLPAEPTVSSRLAHADLVTFSGDKLLGGPQAGIVAGKRELIEKIKANPLKRALRIDKLTLAALQSVLELYLKPHTLRKTLPMLRDLTKSRTAIKQCCEELMPALGESLNGHADVAIVDCDSQVGSGSLPQEILASQGIAITPQPGETGSGSKLQAIADAFRALPKPVIGRMHDGKLIFDLRCLDCVDEFKAQLAQLAL